MKTILALFSFLLAVFISVPLQADAATSLKHSSKLEPDVYVTPQGTPVIRPPKGWSATVLEDKSPSAYVIFTSPDKSMNMQVAVNKDYGESDNALAQTDRIIDLYIGSGQISGKKLSGSVVKNKRTKFGIASGFDVEMKRTDLGGKFRIRHIVVDTVGPDYSYMVTTKISERKWKKNKHILEASFKTLQIPKSFSVQRPVY